MKKTIFLFSLQLIFIYSMAQYVTLKGKDFYVGNEKFYPMVMNYGMSMVFNGENYFLSPYRFYITSNFECSNAADCSDQAQDDFNYIAGMKFNTLRISGFKPLYDTATQLLKFVYTGIPSYAVSYLSVNPYNPSDPGLLIVLSLYEKILELANATTPHPLKIIPMMKGDKTDLDETEVNLLSAFFASLAARLYNSNHGNALLAYDVFNEPAYHTKTSKTKQEACEIVSTWYDIIKANAPNHLVTIGNCGMDDIWSFDPSILKVDFNSLHYYPRFRPYEDRTLPHIQKLARERTTNHLYWFQQSSIVPWIIGETGFTAGRNYGVANGLDGALTDQKNFAAYSLDAVCNCGGSGYSWWQYQDHQYNGFDPGMSGLLEKGTPPSLAIEKPAVEAFRSYTPGVTGPCPVGYSPTVDETKLYYNPYRHTAPNNLKITRHIVDQDGEPIKNAVVRVTTSFGYDSVKMVVNEIPKDTAIWRYNEYYTHTDIYGKFTAIPCPTRYGFVGHGADTTSSHPTISGFKISAAGAETKLYNNNAWTSPPNLIELKKIKDNVEIYSETVLNGQVKVYKGRKSLTVYNTNIHSGGTAYFTSAKTITLSPSFTASAGSNAHIYIAPYDCNEWTMLLPSKESILLAPKNMTDGYDDGNKSKEIKLSFEASLSENTISVFPNPANSTVNIQLHSTNQKSSLNHIKLYDMVGRELFSKQIDGYTHIIDVSSYSKGVYFLEIKDKKTTYHKKIIIQ